MKAFTDLSQSKMLAKILPFKSADMKWFIPADNEGEFIEDVSLIKNKSEYYLFEKVTDWNDTPYLPCWSLAALLDVLPKIYYPIKDHKTDLILGKPKDKWCLLYWDTTGMQHGEETLERCEVHTVYPRINRTDLRVQHRSVELLSFRHFCTVRSNLGVVFETWIQRQVK